MKDLIIESQYNYDYTKQWIPDMDDEILTVQNDTMSIREMLVRATAGTLNENTIPDSMTIQMMMIRISTVPNLWKLEIWMMCIS